MAGTIDIAAVMDERPFSGLQRRVVALCALVALIEGFDTQTVGFVAPALSKAFHLAPDTLGLFFSAGLVGLMLGTLLIAPLADRVGRKPVILASVGLFGLCSLGVANAGSVEILFAFRLLTGLGIGGAMPNLIALTSEYCPSRSRSFTVMLMFSGFTLGALVAGLTAARLLGPYGWSILFWIGGIAPLLYLPVLALALPESVRVLALSEGGQAKAAAILKRIAPDLTIPAGARLAAEGEGPRMSVAELFRHGRAVRTSLLWLLFFMSLLDVYLLTNWLTTLMHQRGFTASTAALISMVQQFGGVVATFPVGWLSARRAPTQVLVGAYLFGGLAVAAIGFTPADPVVIGAVVFCAGLGVVGGQGAANALVAGLHPTAVRSTAVGWALGIGRIGSIVGPAIAGVLIAAKMPTRDLFLFAAIPTLIAAGAAFAIGKIGKAEG